MRRRLYRRAKFYPINGYPRFRVMIASRDADETEWQSALGTLDSDIGGIAGHGTAFIMCQAPNIDGGFEILVSAGGVHQSFLACGNPQLPGVCGVGQRDRSVPSRHFQQL
jgi:hypothetical protein